MKQRGHFWLGLVVGAILAAAVLFSVYYVPRKGLALSRSPVHFTVVLGAAHGLHAGSPVLVSGVEAGEVTGVEIRELPARGYRVLAAVEVFDGERFAPMLKRDSAYQVAQSGLLGETTLAIAPGGQGGPVADQLVDGLPPADLTRIAEDLGHIARRISDFMDGGQPNDPSLRGMLRDLQEAVRNVRDFSEKLPK